MVHLFSTAVKAAPFCEDGGHVLRNILGTVMTSGGIETVQTTCTPDVAERALKQTVSREDVHCKPPCRKLSFLMNSI